MAWENKRDVGTDDRLTARAIARAIGSRLTEQMTLINELSLPVEPLNLRRPGSYLRSGSASALGWAMPCALGMKMVRPESRPIAVVGDGVYYLSNPTAIQWVSQAHELPFLTVILNNEGMPSIHKEATFTSLRPSLAFSEMAAAAGGFGARAYSVSEFEEQFAQGLVALERGKMGVIDARIP